MKSIFASVLTLAMTMAAAPAMAQGQPIEEGKVTSILYTCSLDFKAAGHSIYVGLGYTDLHGDGQIICYDYLTGHTERIPLRVTLRGPGAGLGVTGLIVSGGISGIGLTRGPESLLGRYLTVRASAAVGVGVGAATSLKVAKDAVTLDVSLEIPKGIGGGVDIMSLDIEAAGERQIIDQQVAQPVVQAQPVQYVPAQQAPTTVQNITNVTQTQVIYVQENQPVHLVDAQGNLLKVIYLRPAAH